jgi:hypothetical protein
LSTVGGRAIVARFDAACMSSDGGVLALREVEQRLAIVALGTYIDDPREPTRVVHGLDDHPHAHADDRCGLKDGNDVDNSP